MHVKIKIDDHGAASPLSTSAGASDSDSGGSALSHVDGDGTCCPAGQGSEFAADTGTTSLTTSTKALVPVSFDTERLLDVFLELVRIRNVDEPTRRLLRRAVTFLSLCNFDVNEICVVLAHASAYFLDIYNVVEAKMTQGEAGHILVVLCYVAHCYVLDETCPLREWHAHLFGDYCPLKTLNKAMFHVLELLGYKLRVEDLDVTRRYERLCDAALGTVVL